MLPLTASPRPTAGLDAAERRALALAYVVARAAGTLRRGGALERWGQGIGGDSLDRLGFGLAAIARREPALAAQTMAGLRLRGPQAEQTLRTLLGSLKQYTRPIGYK